jgi:pimeloyl-ACP methyl ester carboxylesterase
VRVATAAGAVIALALGAAAAVGGAAFAVPHLLRSGPSMAVGAGVMVAIAGTITVSWALVRFVRTVPGWWRLLALPAVLIVGYTVCLPLGMAVYATHPPRTELGRSTPTDRGLAYRDVSFPAADGVTLSGWYIPSRNWAAVVLLPGSGSTRTAVLDHAAVLARRGFGVLPFDPRGQGESDGQAMEFGWSGEVDVAAAVIFLRHQPDVDPDRIGAVGLSMGGEQAIGALAADPRLRAVVAEGVTNRVAADKAWLADAYGIRGRVQVAVDAITYGLADLLTEADPPISLGYAVDAAAPRPVLLIAAGNATDEVRADNAIQARSPGSVQLWVVPAARHIAGLFVAPNEWEERVSAFLDTALAGGSPVG